MSCLFVAILCARTQHKMDFDTEFGLGRVKRGPTSSSCDRGVIGWLAPRTPTPTPQQNDQDPGDTTFELLCQQVSYRRLRMINTLGSLLS